jgi:TolB protein
VSRFRRLLGFVVAGLALAASALILIALHQAFDGIGEAGALGGYVAGDTTVSWSSGGDSLVFGRNEESGDHLYRISFDGSGLERLSDHSDGDWAPSASPRDGRLAFTRFDDQSGGIDLFVAAPDGSDARRLADTPDAEDDPAWSPNGRLIAFVRGSTDWGDLYVITADGGEVRRLTRTPLVPEQRPSWSPDGRRIVFSTAYGDIDVIDVRTRSRRSLVKAGLGAPSWSPDGRSIAFAAGRRSLGIVDLGSGRIRHLAARGVADDVAWSPDGSTIAYAAGGAVYLLDVTHGRTRALTGGPESGAIPTR